MNILFIEGVEAVSCGSIAPRLLVFPPAGQEGAAVDEVPQRLRQPLRRGAESRRHVLVQQLLQLQGSLELRVKQE